MTIPQSPTASLQVSPGFQTQAQDLRRGKDAFFPFTMLFQALFPLQMSSIFQTSYALAGIPNFSIRKSFASNRSFEKS